MSMMHMNEYVLLFRLRLTRPRMNRVSTYVESGPAA